MTKGRVKKKEYLRFLASVRKEEQYAELLGHQVVPKTIEEVRTEFEQRYETSIYMNI